MKNITLSIFFVLCIFGCKKNKNNNPKGKKIESINLSDTGNLNRSALGTEDESLNHVDIWKNKNKNCCSCILFEEYSEVENNTKKLQEYQVNEDQCEHNNSFKVKDEGILSKLLDLIKSKKSKTLPFYFFDEQKCLKKGYLDSNNDDHLEHESTVWSINKEFVFDIYYKIPVIAKDKMGACPFNNKNIIYKNNALTFIGKNLAEKDGIGISIEFLKDFISAEIDESEYESTTKNFNNISNSKVKRKSMFTKTEKTSSINDSEIEINISKLQTNWEIKTKKGSLDLKPNLCSLNQSLRLCESNYWIIYHKELKNTKETLPSTFRIATFLETFIICFSLIRSNNYDKLLDTEIISSTKYEYLQGTNEVDIFPTIKITSDKKIEFSLLVMNNKSSRNFIAVKELKNNSLEPVCCDCFQSNKFCCGQACIRPDYLCYCCCCPEYLYMQKSRCKCLSLCGLPTLGVCTCCMMCCYMPIISGLNVHPTSNNFCEEMGIICRII